MPRSAARRFTGGTLAFQCDDLEAAAAPLRFDLTGLAISALVLLQLLKQAAAPIAAWPRAALDAAVARVEDVALRARIAQLLASEGGGGGGGA